MALWLSKPLYEALPFFYLLTGLMLMGISRLFDDDFWPGVCLASGVLLAVAGILLWWYRRIYRRSR
jgi:hypothetical protein